MKFDVLRNYLFFRFVNYLTLASLKMAMFKVNADIIGHTHVSFHIDLFLKRKHRLANSYSLPWLLIPPPITRGLENHYIMTGFGLCKCFHVSRMYWLFLLQVVGYFKPQFFSWRNICIYTRIYIHIHTHTLTTLSLFSTSVIHEPTHQLKTGTQYITKNYKSINNYVLFTA